jgi:hypothetical protein
MQAHIPGLRQLLRAIRDRKPFSYKRYYCRLHGFYVNSHGYCPSFSTEPFVPPDAPKPSPYTQPELF